LIVLTTQEFRSDCA